jgi:hypothetical protein
MYLFWRQCLDLGVSRYAKMDSRERTYIGFISCCVKHWQLSSSMYVDTIYIIYSFISVYYRAEVNGLDLVPEEI